MAGLLRPLLFRSTLLFLLSCDALLSDGPPTLLSTSQPSQPSPLSLMDLDQDVEEQPEMMTVPGSLTKVPGLTSQGQESSGSFHDDNKPLQSSVHLWEDVRDQVNITGLDRKSLRGYSQTLSQTSTSPMEEPRQGNPTSPFMDAVERQERELWEMERESSGLPLEAGYGQNLPTPTSNTTFSNTTTSNTTTTTPTSTTTTTTPTSNTTTSNTTTSNTTTTTPTSTTTTTPTSNTTTSNTTTTTTPTSNTTISNTTTPTSNTPTPTTPAADPLVPVDSTTLDPQYVPVYGGSQSTPEDRVEVEVADEEEEEEEEEEERESSTPEPDASTSRPNLPEVGVFPSLGPLQSDNTHTEDQDEVVEEDEVAVVLGGPRSDSGRAGRGGEISPLTTVPLASLAPTVDFTEDSWDRLEDEEMFAGKEIQEKEQRQQQERRQEEERRNEEEEQEVRHGGTELLTEAELLHGAHFSQEIQQVICVDWSDLAGKGYVILNMSDNVDCDEFRVESGDRLLELLETAFSRKMNSPQGSWLISLSKPTRQDHQLLITLASEHGVIATQDMLSMLGEIRRGLHEIGIQNYSSASTCHSRPSQTRSDYGKLFVVLVIIGSVCVVIIASGLIYIFLQRRLPKIKTMTRGEEFHFVENGCHDNPTLDVTSDGGGQPEMQEKKHRHANGLTSGSGGEGGSSGWQVLVNKPGGKEEDNMEEDTHL